MRNQGRPRLGFTDVAIAEKHVMERHQSQPMAGDCQRHTYLEETYQTLLKPSTVLVEPTDCHVDDILGRSNHL